MKSSRLSAAGLLLVSAVLTACGPVSPPGIAPILMFAGKGSSPNDVSAIETILNDSQLKYATANSAQLNGMTASQLAAYRLLIVPGGNFIDMGNSLTAGTTESIRNAVTGGMNYLGICAGGFLAGHFPAPYKSFNLSSGVKFGFYSASGKGIRKTAVRITMAEGPALDHYWEDGPQFTGWGDVIGKYPDGMPAIVEGSAGQGWVILSGVHPEAPANWRRGLAFNTPMSDDIAYARTLIVAALNHTVLSHY